MNYACYTYIFYILVCMHVCILCVVVIIYYYKRIFVCILLFVFIFVRSSLHYPSLNPPNEKQHTPHPHHRLAEQPLPPGTTPLVAVVNSKSGGRQGKSLLKRLRSALSRAQVRTAVSWLVDCLIGGLM